MEYPDARVPLEAAAAHLTRRDFIRRSALGITGLALAHALLPACAPARPAPPDLRALGAVEFATLSAAADRIVAGVSFPGGPDAIARLFDQNLSIAPSWLRSLFIDAVRFLEFSPLVMALPPGRFSTRPAEGRDAILHAMANSSLMIRRQVFAAVKQAVLVTSYGDPATWDLISYDGPGAIFDNRRRRR